MKGYIVKVGEDYLNWQLLLVEEKYAVPFRERADADLVASNYPDSQVIEVDRLETDAVGNVKLGTYFEYHKDF